MARVLMIGFWVIIIPLAVYTFINGFVQRGEEKEAAKPQYRQAPPEPIKTKVVQTKSGARVRVTGYELISPDDDVTYDLNLTIRNEGDRPVSGTVTLYPYRLGYGTNLQGDEFNIIESDQFWSISTSLPLTHLRPGESQTLLFHFQKARQRFPVQSYNAQNVKLDLKEY